jgi:hypothetical protein
MVNYRLFSRKMIFRHSPQDFSAAGYASQVQKIKMRITGLSHLLLDNSGRGFVQSGYFIEGGLL